MADYSPFTFAITPDGSGLEVFEGGVEKGIAVLNAVPPPSTSHLLTEDGNFLTTEDNQLLSIE